MKYKIGDKVRIVDKWNVHCNNNSCGEMDHWLGKVMTIRDIDRHCYRMVEDELENFGRGWFWNEHCIAELAVDQKIVITVNGNETLARLYDGKNVVKSATAKCSPDDEFDFEVGAKLAIERLFLTEKAKDQKTFEVGDVVIIGNGKLKIPAISSIQRFCGEVAQIVGVYINHSVGVEFFKKELNGILPWVFNADDVIKTEKMVENGV